MSEQGLTPPDCTGTPLRDGIDMAAVVDTVRDFDTSGMFCVVLRPFPLPSERWDCECVLLDSEQNETFSLEVFPYAIRVYTGGWEQGLVRSQAKLDLHQRVLARVRDVCSEFVAEPISHGLSDRKATTND